MSNTKKLIIAASIAVFIILAILFISFGLPFFTASKILKARITELESMKAGETIQISDPYNSDGSPLPTTVDIFLSGNEADELVSELLGVIRSARYVSKETNIHGFWDVSLSLRSTNGKTSVYLCDDEIYVTDSTAKYSFKPKNSTEYSELFKKISNMLYEEANSTHE